MEDELIGKQLANYHIERLIGRGGMAAVYFATDVKLERSVAIKVIDDRFRENPAYKERLLREARSIATWHHENIVQVYYAGDEAGLFYFAMEFVDGQDLDHILKQYADAGKRIPYEDVLRYGRGVASALDYAHGKGIIHRDVKPANVLVSNDGRIMLSDFGLALDVQQDVPGEASGSVHYMAPEQAHPSEAINAQSDLYSLGIMLYQMLTGSLPFDDPSPISVAIQQLTLAPPAPRQVNPDLSQAVEDVLLKALSKDPAQRFQSGEELMAALEAALKNGKSAALGIQLDEYRLESLLGKGGMASVYRALDVHLHRYAAIKIIAPAYREKDAYQARFEREARAIAQLEHPHVVRIYRFGEAQGLLYMAMQYIEGSDLEQILESYRQDGEFMEPQDISRIIREVAEALDYVHSMGIIHRDIKPSNIMLDKTGNTILTDFGLVLRTESGTLGKVLGSPQYLAPEQAISSASAVAQSDLYSLGVILYEIFTGQLPFDVSDPLELAMLHVTQEPPPPSSIRPDLSPAVEKVILKALAKKPEDRYASGRALAEALDNALQLDASPAAPAEPSERLGQSIPERVASQFAEHPLPPLPTPGQYRSPVQSRQLSPQPPASGPIPAPASQPAQVPRTRLKFLTLAGWLLALAILVVALWAGSHYLATRQSGSPIVVPTQIKSHPTLPIDVEVLPVSPSPAQPSPVLLPSVTQPAPTAATTQVSPALSPTLLALPPSATPRYLSGRHFILFYNDTSFYMLQVGGYGGLIAPLAFERLDDQGNPLNRFDGDAWAEYHTSTFGDWCMVLKILDAGNYLDPAQCEGHVLATRFPAPDSPWIFWTQSQNSSQFRALWGTEEVGRCEIAAQTCEVYLP
jgi:serine/threonine protein kinase